MNQCVQQRSLARALSATIACAVVVSAAPPIWLPYAHGGATSLLDDWGYSSAPQIGLKWTASQLNMHGALTPGVIGNFLGGALVVVALMVARTSLASFPIHPAGFLVAATYPIYTMWFSLFLGWVLKSPLMRYAGMRGYRLFLPFFLGLILGDCLNAIMWTAIGLVTHTGYRLLPG